MQGCAKARLAQGCAKARLAQHGAQRKAQRLALCLNIRDWCFLRDDGEVLRREHFPSYKKLS